MEECLKHTYIIRMPQQYCFLKQGAFHYKIQYFFDY
jgi:hypothetical protein